MDIEDLFKVAFGLIVVLGSIFGPLIQRYAKKKKEEAARGRAVERGEAYDPRAEERVSEPEVPEAKLPYEEMADELFGDYIESRQEKEDDIVIHDVEEVAEAPVSYRRPQPARKMPLPKPAQRPLDVIVEDPVHDMDPTVPEHHQFKVQEHESPHALQLDELVFKGRRVSPVTRAIVYSEIFGPPRAMRGNRR